MLGYWRNAQFIERVESLRVLRGGPLLWDISHPIRRGDIARDVVQDAALVCRGFDENSRVKSRTRYVRVLYGEAISREVDFIVPGHSGFSEGVSCRLRKGWMRTNK